MQSERKDFSKMTPEELFRNRLFLEACQESPHVYDDMDTNTKKQIKKDLKQVVSLSAAGYEEWKTKYLNDELENRKDIKFITIPYMFIGIGSYIETIPEIQLEGFKQWIAGNGSAFMDQPREATEDEIKICIAKHALD